MPEAQGVTVVVPTLNRGKFLSDCLADLLVQKHRPLEILVVDQSEDARVDVEKLAREHPAVISYHRLGFRGLLRARNYAWQNAKFDAIVFVDDDIRCGPELVGAHLCALSTTGAGLVAGGVDEPNRPVDAAPPTGRFSKWLAEPLRGFAATGEAEADHAAGCNFSAWRAAIEAAGGFDEALNVGAALYEETDLCLRVKKAGFGIRFDGRARLTHLVAPKGGCRVEEVPRYVFGLAHNRGILIRRHLRWYHYPTALARLVQLILSYALHYRSLRAVWTGLAGLRQGWQAGGAPPVAGRYRLRPAGEQTGCVGPHTGPKRTGD